MNSSPELDSKDWKILEALQQDARQSLSALGKRIGLSQPAVSERIRKLEDAGVIEGYGVRLNLQKLGYGLQALIRLRARHDEIPAFVTTCAAMPEVLEMFRITGEDCFCLRCAIARPQELERLIDALSRYGAVTTSIVLSKPLDKPVSRVEPELAR
ncbi:Lrp/AsnC family transcriptional regulator [Chitinolyticbacter meiyuanensis]|uniref:Lrp/AsnC family transcriptional regulator n=1 Tax=Chitinolyticbacter meiyuanensis TaxID=682798 RepID=UPI001C9E5482|nr:Lrp/AsnC family transcriptional regulator [Chitinolyticbacter meiyuanensis]